MDNCQRYHLPTGTIVFPNTNETKTFLHHLSKQYSRRGPEVGLHAGTLIRLKRDDGRWKGDDALTGRLALSPSRYQTNLQGKQRPTTFPLLPDAKLSAQISERTSWGGGTNRFVVSDPTNGLWCFCVHTHIHSYVVKDSARTKTIATLGTVGQDSRLFQITFRSPDTGVRMTEGRERWPSEIPSFVKRMRQKWNGITLYASNQCFILRQKVTDSAKNSNRLHVLPSTMEFVGNKSNQEGNN